MSIESVMPSNHLILCRPLLLLPSVFPSIWVFSNVSVSGIVSIRSDVVNVEKREERQETRNHLSKQSLHPELDTHPAHTLHRREEGRSRAGPQACDLTGGSPWPSRIGVLARP